MRVLPLLLADENYHLIDFSLPLKTCSPRLSRTQSLTCVSTLAAVATASGAHAAIIVFNTPITSNNSTGGSVTWNIDGTGSAEGQFVNLGATSKYKRFGVYANGFGLLKSAGGKLQGLGANVPISVAKAFSPIISDVLKSGNIQNAVNFVSGASTYIGFQFNPSGSQVLYGWANVTLTNGGSFGTFTINNWAYDNTGASILTGQSVSAVPEPATSAVGLGALALGAAALRRRRQARALAA